MTRPIREPMKQRSSYGWRFEEPGSGDRAPQAPQFLCLGASLSEMSRDQLADRAHLPDRSRQADHR